LMFLSELIKHYSLLSLRTICKSPASIGGAFF
jgi:hypothetical protein